MKQLDLITSQGPSNGKKMKSVSRGRESNKKASGRDYFKALIFKKNPQGSAYIWE